MTQSPTETLEVLMESAQKGDKVAYENLLTLLSKNLRGYLRKRVSSADDVEDVLQEILISIHKARHTYDRSRPLLPWVYAIAKFRLNDYLRKQYRDISRESIDYSEVESQLADDVTEQGIQSEELKKALDMLPDKQREIVMMMKVEGYTAKEVAGHFDMNVSAVKVAAHRAYKQLKEKMEKMDNENG